MIATSSTPDTRSRPAGRRPRGGIPRLPVSAPRPVALARRLPAVLLGLGLVALMGLTTWAVASVSSWLVPAYLALLVLIFAAPGGARVTSPAREPTTGPSDAGVAPSEQDTGSDRADGMGLTHPAADPTPEVPIGGAAGSSATRHDPAGPLMAKPRRSRARTRKAVKPAAEPVSDSSSAPVTWIRVGPGQFVRADGRIPETDQATAEPPTPEVTPVTDERPPLTLDPEVVLDATPVIDDLAVVPSLLPPEPLEVLADPVPDDATEPAPDVERSDPSTGEDSPEPSAEEYGIAPSAFGGESGDCFASPSPVPGVPDGPVLPMVDPGRIADIPGPPSNDVFALRRPGLPPPRSWVRAAFLTRGIANVFPGRRSGATSSRRGVRTPPGPRTARGRRSAKDLRLRQAFWRAYGRTDHVQRDRRSRSPPRPAA